jgi:hypothetical protein
MARSRSGALAGPRAPGCGRQLRCCWFHEAPTGLRCRFRADDPEIRIPVGMRNDAAISSGSIV